MITADKIWTLFDGFLNQKEGVSKANKSKRGTRWKSKSNKNRDEEQPSDRQWERHTKTQVSETWMKLNKCKAVGAGPDLKKTSNLNRTCCPRNMTQVMTATNGDKQHRSRCAHQQKGWTRAWKTVDVGCEGNSSVCQPLVQVSLSSLCLVSQRSPEGFHHWRGLQ